MAALALGLVGGFAFGPVGFLVGSLIGNLLFPEKQQGPRLTNLKLQGSSYGEMIPIIFGAFRTSGQVICQTDLKEHSHSTGGKGGPKITTFTYSVSFAVKVCKGPMAGVLAIWANGTLVYDTRPGATVDNSQVPVTIYLGVETANPDPTFEGVLGIGNVPAFRDDVVCVFTDWDVGPYGNTLPQLSFLVCEVFGGIPNRVSTWTPPLSGPDPSGTTSRLGGANFQADGTLAISIYLRTTPVSPPGAPDSVAMTTNVYDIDGNLQSTVGPISVPPAFGAAHYDAYAVQNDSTIAYGAAFQQGGGNPDASCWYVNGSIQTEPVTPPTGTDSLYSSIIAANPFLYRDSADPSNNALFVLGGLSNTVYWVARYNAPGGIPFGTSSAYFPLPNLVSVGGAAQVTVGNDGNVYVVTKNNNTGVVEFYKLDRDLNLLDTVVAANIPSVWKGSAPLAPFKVHDGMVMFGESQTCYVYDMSTLPWTQVGTLGLALDTPQYYSMVDLGGCDALTQDGIISMCGQPSPVTLGHIVSQISIQGLFRGAGLSSGDIDVTQLTPYVDGYMLSTQGDCRSDIEPLRSAWFFDAVESSGVIKFVMRGASSALTIPDDDLAAQQRGEKPPAIVEVIRTTDDRELPALVNVTYVNSNAAWQKGTQSARRQVGSSQAVSSLELPIAMSDVKGRQVADVNCFGGWIERDAFTFKTSRKYDYLEPTDVITAHGYTLRITKKSETVVGVLDFEGVETVAALYVGPQQSGSPTSGGQQPQSPSSQATDMILLDIPLILDSDDQNSIRAAMAGKLTPAWPGARLYKSSDGVTYSEVSGGLVANTIGSVTPALGDYDALNNIPDETNRAHVTIGNGGGELSSVTLDQMLNGANEGLIGQEFVQWRTATLTAPSEYDLTGLLRGRRGTEWATGTHIDGDLFVAFDPTVPIVPAPFGEIGMTEYYKAVTGGGSIAATTAQTFANTANSLKCYSPVQLGGGIVSAGGDVQVQGVRRTRIGGNWVNLTDVPLGEPTEKYVFQFWDASYTQCARYVITTVPSYTYTSAMQVTDFGANQQHIYFTMGQIGTVSVGGQTRGVAPGIGGSDGLPLTPIVPYSFNPIISPPPPPGGACLPVSHASIGPGNAAITATLTVGSQYIFAFITPTGAYAQGTLSSSEYGGQPVIRYVRIFSDCACTALIAAAGGTTATIIWAPLLAHNTTYYAMVDFQNPDGSFTASVGTPSPSLIDFVP
jgi:hypothetical protein